MRLSAKLAIVLIVSAAALFAGETLDRVVASVDGHAVLESERETEIRCEQLMAGTAPQDPDETHKREALDRLIDQKLLLQQMHAAQYEVEKGDAINAQIADIRARLGVKDNSRWHALLDRYDLTEDEFREQISAQLTTLRFIDERFRPTVRIEDSSIATYYRTVLVPELAKQNVPAPSLESVTPKIREILVQQQVDQQLAAWLKELRATSRVLVVDEDRTERADTNPNSEAQ